MRKLLILLVPVVLFAAAWFIAGFSSGPTVEIVWPTFAVGQSGELNALIKAPGGRLSDVHVTLEQGETQHTVYSMHGMGATPLAVEGDSAVRLLRPIGKQHTPTLQQGPARIVITAGRPVFMGMQQATTTVTRDVAVQLVPPQVSVQSAHHYINLGGAEMVVYRVSAGAVVSGVRVGEEEYPGFTGSDAGIANADSTLRVAFFALPWNSPPNTSITVFARDDAGNVGVAPLEHRVFPKVFRQSRITVDDPFLARVVPAILANSPEFTVENPADLLGSYVKINREMRRVNDSVITGLAAETSPRILWEGPFKQLSNTAVEAGFADQRTYLYKGEEIDKQVHLGFDLASTAAAPVMAANSGSVVFAGWLGIYGNCVIVDHGMGLQSLYAHLTSIDVTKGAAVTMNQQLGRTGATGLAGGDHLHFTMLLNGRAVTAVDWWSVQWVQDRIIRKLREAESQ